MHGNRVFEPQSEKMTPANGTFGNLGRNAFRAQDIAQFALGVSKFVPVTQKG
jgi:hypothetical protein